MEQELTDKVHESHLRVLDSFYKYRLQIGPIPVFISDQDTLQLLTMTERLMLEMPEHYVNAVYSSYLDSIVIDGDTLLVEELERIDRILAHEYAHRLSLKVIQKYNSSISTGPKSLPPKREKTNKTSHYGT